MIYLLYFILIFSVIYIHYGLFTLIQIMIWTLVFLLSNLILGINPDNKEMHVARLISIITIIFIFYYNSSHLSILLSFIVPISVNNITFIDELMGEVEPNPTDIVYIRNCNVIWFQFNDIKGITTFINWLDPNKVYVIYFDLITDKSKHDLNDPTILLSKPILITKESNPWLINNFLKEKVRLACDKYGLNDINLEIEDVGILVKFRQIIIFYYFF